jgi:hypothetical protein
MEPVTAIVEEEKETAPATVQRDEKGFPITRDTAGNLILGIKGPEFFVGIDPFERFEAIRRKLEYFRDVAQYRLTRFVEANDPKKLKEQEIARKKLELERAIAELQRM